MPTYLVPFRAMGEAMVEVDADSKLDAINKANKLFKEEGEDCFNTEFFPIGDPKICKRHVEMLMIE